MTDERSTLLQMNSEVEQKRQGVFRKIWRRAGGLAYSVSVNAAANLVCLLLGFIVGSLFQRTEVLTLGFTNHPIDFDVGSLAREYRAQIANDASRRASEVVPPWPMRRLVFEVEVVEGAYANIFTALRKREVDLAFVPSYSYLLYLSSNAGRLDDQLVAIGALTKFAETTYRTGFVVHDGSSIRTLEDVKNVVPGAGSGSLILNREDASTSTRVVPSLILWEWGLEEAVVSARYLTRADMLGAIKDSDPSRNLIGVLSDDDWRRAVNLRDNGGLRYITAEERPMPLDVVLANKRSWNALGREHDALFRALRPWVRRDIDWRKRYRAFAEYVVSGVVVGQAGDSLWRVLLPPQGGDLCRLAEACAGEGDHPVEVWAFRREGVRGASYELVRDSVGTGVLRKNLRADSANEYELRVGNCARTDLSGLHVFPVGSRARLLALAAPWEGGRK